MHMRKSLIIFLTFFAIVALGGGTYYAWVTSRNILTSPDDRPAGGSLPVTSGDGPTEGTNGNAGSQGSSGALQTLSDHKVVGYWVTSRTAGSVASGTIIYAAEDGAIYKTSLSADQDERVVQGIATPVHTVHATPDGTVALLESGSAHAPQFTLFFVANNAVQVLPASMGAALSPNNKQVAYWEPDGDVMIRDLAGARPVATRAFNFPHYDMTLSWPRTQILTFLTRPSSIVPGDLWEYTIATKKLVLAATGAGLLNTWAPDGLSQLRFVVGADRTATTRFIDAKGVSRASIIATLPSKCAFHDAHVYCGVAQSYGPRANPVMPDDYLKRAVYSRDALYRITPSSETSEAIFTSADPIDAINLRVSQNTLLFINRYDRILYSLAL